MPEEKPVLRMAACLSILGSAIALLPKLLAMALLFQPQPLMDAPSSVINQNLAVARVSGEGIVIDGGGRTLMPGLIDAHVHLAICANFGQIESDFTAGDIHLNAAVAARHTFLDGFTSVLRLTGP